MHVIKQLLDVHKMRNLITNRNFWRWGPVLANGSHCIRKFSNFEKCTRLVYQSQSHDIFTNLALEDWFYRNWDFEDRNLLLLWSNDPCVVIGRHQNTWIEANLKYLLQNNINISRRNSGGGTVYHDLGNLNCTFFTHRASYNRKRNLEFICQTLRQEWNLDIQVSPREDIILNQSHKISGTASKLGNKVAYHHCTLLIDVDSSHLHQALAAPDLGMDSKATASVRSKVINLNSCFPTIAVDSCVSLLGNRFLAEHPASPHQGIPMLEPTEENFPGLDKIRGEFTGWDWNYGKTPKFIIQWPRNDREPHLQLEVHRGVVDKVTVSINSANEENLQLLTNLLTGRKLDSELYSQVVESHLLDSMDSSRSCSLMHLLSHLCARC